MAELGAMTDVNELVRPDERDGKSARPIGFDFACDLVRIAVFISYDAQGWRRCPQIDLELVDVANPVVEHILDMMRRVRNAVDRHETVGSPDNLGEPPKPVVIRHLREVAGGVADQRHEAVPKAGEHQFWQVRLLGGAVFEPNFRIQTLQSIELLGELVGNDAKFGQAVPVHDSAAKYILYFRALAPIEDFTA